ncbi:MAG: dTDP-4-dehydrorhamnose 3,5-epimerase [Bacteroidia bacterium]|nr:dTDP-4-dehydrorhamnose 3,5-epimerase [Bacteroidia bacterium]
MSSYRWEPLSLDGAILLHSPKYTDDRGFFLELFRAYLCEAIGFPPFVQDNLSFSRQGVLRGLHFQRPPHAQAKLVTVLSGHVQDVLVDLRPGSPTYKQWIAVDLKVQERELTWVYVPVGFAHGFLVLSEEAIVLYRCSAYYHPDADGGIRWDDPGIGVQWRLSSGQLPLLSSKDARLPYFDEASNPFFSL